MGIPVFNGDCSVRLVPFRAGCSALICAQSGTPPAPPAAPQTTVLEQDGLRVVEQLYNLPAHTMTEQVLCDIEADPETQLVDTDGHSLTYLEFPGDGSEVLWKTWLHDNYQIFVASPHAHRAEHRTASNVPHGIRLCGVLTACNGLNKQASFKKFSQSFSCSEGFQKVFCKTMEPEGLLDSPNK